MLDVGDFEVLDECASDEDDVDQKSEYDYEYDEPDVEDNNDETNEGLEFGDKECSNLEEENSADNTDTVLDVSIDVTENEFLETVAKDFSENIEDEANDKSPKKTNKDVTKAASDKGKNDQELEVVAVIPQKKPGPKSKTLVDSTKKKTPIVITFDDSKEKFLNSLEGSITNAPDTANVPEKILEENKKDDDVKSPEATKTEIPEKEPEKEPLDVKPEDEEGNEEKANENQANQPETSPTAVVTESEKKSPIKEYNRTFSEGVNLLFRSSTQQHIMINVTGKNLKQDFIDKVKTFFETGPGSECNVKSVYCKNIINHQSLLQASHQLSHQSLHQKSHQQSHQPSHQSSHQPSYQSSNQSSHWDKSFAPRKANHQRWTVLKSKHVHKKHRVQYEMRTYYRFLNFLKLTGSTADTFLEYIQRNLPEGVAMKVTMVS
ncbi:unnamed protein product [Trichogramma brassicae]|uniref:Small ribosomal subunit protein uS10m n=1 Tax=Trichogramma brassicae TaxID=86971 RepID=A0A6H5I9C2_9HYME|nr:unnamed protein product [Trichogramma brassicae]